jgi:vitamin B12 transport system substrate-binding protein
MAKQIMLWKALGLMLSFAFLASNTQAGTLAEQVLQLEETKQTKPKIIALSPHIVELLFEIGAGDQIIGTTDYADYPKQALAIERVGNAVKLKLEEIVALSPDIIIAWTSGNPAQDLDKLKTLGFRVEYSQPDTFDELIKEIEYFGSITGNQKQANVVALKMQKKLSALKDKYQQAKPINVFYEVWHEPLTTVAANAWSQHQLELCNVTNPFEYASLDYPQISVEALLQKNIQVIIQPTSSHSSLRSFFDWSRFNSIAAVQNSQFIQPNADALHRMTSRSLDEVVRLCSQLEQARKFYEAND